jgi:hypothetical protein
MLKLLEQAENKAHILVRFLLYCLVGIAAGVSSAISISPTGIERQFYNRPQKANDYKRLARIAD